MSVRRKGSDGDAVDAGGGVGVGVGVGVAVGVGVDAGDGVGVGDGDGVVMRLGLTGAACTITPGNLFLISAVVA